MSNSIAAYWASDLAYPEADSNLDSKLRDSTSAVPCSDEADSGHTQVFTANKSSRIGMFKN